MLLVVVMVVGVGVGVGVVVVAVVMMGVVMEMHNGLELELGWWVEVWSCLLWDVGRLCM